MPILDARHDLGHPVEGDTAWSESYYFNGYDPGTDSGLFTRIGIRPNEGTMDVGLSVWLPGGDLAEYRAVVEQHEMVDTDLAGRGRPLPDARADALVAADLSTRDVPARPCARRVDQRPRRARVRLDLRFDSLTPPVGTDGQGAAAARVGRGRPTRPAPPARGTSSRPGTLDRLGRGRRRGATTGTGRSATATGPGVPGTGAGPPMWRWFSINVDERLHFGGIRLGTGHGDLHRGWVCRRRPGGQRRRVAACAPRSPTTG